jgi:hypothetical protein
MIDLVIEFDLELLRSKDYKASSKNPCLICGKEIKEPNPKMVQLLTNGNIVSTLEDMDNSQGLFPVGKNCAKKLVLNFAF